MGEIKQVEFNKPILSGELSVPGDKSISHRAIMLGSIAKGKTNVTGFLDGEDCLRTIDMFRQLGVSIERKGTEVTIDSPGIQNWKTPTEHLYAGNSGTTARLMLGILAGSKITSVLTGDESLSVRPMNRVTIPLKDTGAQDNGRNRCKPSSTYNYRVTAFRNGLRNACGERTSEIGNSFCWIKC